jgi:hypothetical protein
MNLTYPFLNYLQGVLGDRYKTAAADKEPKILSIASGFIPDAVISTPPLSLLAGK